jgi:hypothetical protein
MIPKKIFRYKLEILGEILLLLETILQKVSENCQPTEDVENFLLTFIFFECLILRYAFMCYKKNFSHFASWMEHTKSLFQSKLCLLWKQIINPSENGIHIIADSQISIDEEPAGLAFDKKLSTVVDVFRIFLLSELSRGFSPKNDEHRFSKLTFSGKSSKKFT